MKRYHPRNPEKTIGLVKLLLDAGAKLKAPPQDYKCFRTHVPTACMGLPERDAVMLAAEYNHVQVLQQMIAHKDFQEYYDNAESKLDTIPCLMLDCTLRRTGRNCDIDGGASCDCEEKVTTSLVDHGYLQADAPRLPFRRKPRHKHHLLSEVAWYDKGCSWENRLRFDLSNEELGCEKTWRARW